MDQKRGRRTEAEKVEAAREPAQTRSWVDVTADFPAPSTNSNIDLCIVPEFAPEDPRTSVRRDPEGSPGYYKVTFILCTPGQATAVRDIDVVSLLNSGDSLLVVPTGIIPEVQVYNEHERVTIRFIQNSNTRLSRVEMRFVAQNRQHAEHYAYDLVHPVLSWWSYIHDVAIDTMGYEIIEEAADVRSYHVTVIGAAKPFQFGRLDFKSTPEHRAILSAYREASNATNVFYQFLCFYRGIEGVKKLRRQNRKKAISGSADYREPIERIPATRTDISGVDLTDLPSFEPYLGAKFTAVRDKLRPVLRNAVAHLDPKNDVVADRFDDLERCRNSIPVMRYMCREMIRNELRPPTPAGSDGSETSLERTR